MTNRKRAWAVLLFLLFLAGLFPRAACATGMLSFWVSPDGNLTDEAVLWEKGKGGYILFLPGNADIHNWRIGYSGGGEPEINGTAVRPGDAADVLAEENAFRCGGKEYRLYVLQGSPGLPAMHIITESGSMDAVHRKKSNREPGRMVLRSGSGETEYNGNLEHIRLRGNGTATYPKKNYQIKLEKGTSLLGMGKAKRWVLRGSYIDKSLLREQIAFDLARFAGMEYVPEHAQCELYINHQYIGLYLLTEKIEPDDDRVDIADLEKATEELNGEKLKNFSCRGFLEPAPGRYKYYDIPKDPEDITGGYILEYEGTKDGRYRSESSAFQTKRGINILVKSPEYASMRQMEYISGKIQSMENAIFAEDGTDPVTGKHYTELIDTDSFAKKYILAELTKNYDSNSSSEYMYKPQDKRSDRIFAGPVWDFDNCMADYARSDNKKKVMRTDGLFVGGASGAALYWPALYRQESFRDRVRTLYRDLFRPAVDILLGKEKDPDGILLSLDGYAARIRESAEMNFLKYPELKNDMFNASTGKNPTENLEYIRRFLRERAAFLNSEWTPEIVVDD